MPQPHRGPSADPSRFLPGLAAEGLACLRFYTRLPCPTLAFETGRHAASFGRVLRWAPLAGATVGLCGAAVLAVGAWLGLPALLAATLALLTTVLASGGLHEDGLGDVADGFGGGSTVSRKLEIMRDSRLGSYGALAICFTLLLRVGALSALVERNGVAAAALVLVAAASVSRGFGLMPLALLPPARSDGLGHGAGRLDADILPTALLLALAIGGSLPILGGMQIARTLLALGLATGAAMAVTTLARRQIGGQTGDVAGAAQQVCEVAFLLGLLATPHIG